MQQRFGSKYNVVYPLKMQNYRINCGECNLYRIWASLDVFILLNVSNIVIRLSATGPILKHNEGYVYVPI